MPPNSNTVSVYITQIIYGIDGCFCITNQLFHKGISGFNITLTNNTGRLNQLILESGTSLSLSGSITADANSDIIVEANTTFTYNGSGAQTIYAIDYGDLTIGGSDRQITLQSGTIVVQFPTVCQSVSILPFQILPTYTIKSSST